MPDDPEERYLKNDAKARRSGGLRSARKKLRRNLKSRAPRSRAWADYDPDEWDALGYDARERIMPRDEGDRRRALEQAAFRAARGEEAGPRPAPADVARDAWTVVAVSSGSCRVVLEDRSLDCRLRGSVSGRESEFTNAVAVGDEVVVGEDGAGGGIVEEVLPRRTILARPDVFHPHRRQVIVANADQLLIVSSWREPTIWLELIDRCLVAAARNRLEPIICVNKTDLAEDEVELRDALRPYDDLDHRTIFTSALTGRGIDELRRALVDRTTALAGLSGTGKSSLVSLVQPGLDLRTQAISSSRDQGRHTTAQSRMYPLTAGGAVVDTPGIREFGLAGMRRRELVDFFPEIAAHASSCRFGDCSHVNEPDCAVLAAESEGTIPRARCHSYRAIRATLPE